MEFTHKLNESEIAEENSLLQLTQSATRSHPESEDISTVITLQLFSREGELDEESKVQDAKLEKDEVESKNAADNSESAVSEDPSTLQLFSKEDDLKEVSDFKDAQTDGNQSGSEDPLTQLKLAVVSNEVNVAVVEPSSEDAAERNGLPMEEVDNVLLRRMPREILNEVFLKDQLKVKSAAKVAKDAGVQLASVIYYAKKFGIEHMSASNDIKPKPKEILTKEFLKEALKSKPAVQVAKESGVQLASVQYFAKKFGIKYMSASEAKTISAKDDVKERTDIVATDPGLDGVVMKITFVSSSTNADNIIERVVSIQKSSCTLEKLQEEFISLFGPKDFNKNCLVYQDSEFFWMMLRNTNDLSLALEVMGQKLRVSIKEIGESSTAS